MAIQKKKSRNKHDQNICINMAPISGKELALRHGMCLTDNQYDDYYAYSETCDERPPDGNTESGHIWHVVFHQKYKWIEM